MSGFMWIVDKSSFIVRLFVLGMFGKSSLVNTLVMNSLKVSAFSCAVDAIEPSVFFNIGILGKVLSWDLAYFQNCSGFLFVLFARFFSKPRFSSLVRTRSLSFSMTISSSVMVCPSWEISSPTSPFSIFQSQGFLGQVHASFSLWLHFKGSVLFY